MSKSLTMRDASIRLDTVSLLALDRQTDGRTDRSGKIISRSSACVACWRAME